MDNRERETNGGISEIFASDTLFVLLAVIYQNTERRYYIKELIEMSGRFPRSVTLALDKLEKSGAVSTERQNGRKYFWANEKYNAFGELKKIMDWCSIVRTRSGSNVLPLDKPINVPIK